jgi:hypothetical protein
MQHTPNQRVEPTGLSMSGTRVSAAAPAAHTQRVRGLR